jgi:hypothetical protein
VAESEFGSSLTLGGGVGGRPTSERSRPPGDPRSPNGIQYLRPGEKMSEEDFQHIIFVWATDARNYTDEFVALERAESTNYYKGRLPDIDEEGAKEDRSRAVITEVRDTVLGVMPDLLRIFFQSEGVVKYLPTACDDPNMFRLREEQARQATEYVHNVVMRTDNPDSFQTFYDCFQDALVRKTGLIKWWWDRNRRPKYSTHTGLNLMETTVLIQGDDVEVVGKKKYPDPLAPGQSLYDVQIKRTEERGRLRIRAVPCEHIVIARRNYGNVDMLSLFGYTEDKRAGEFIAEGWVDDLDELATCDNDITDADNIETQARQVKPATFVSPADNVPEDPSERLIKYGEFYARIDKDGDGIPELYFVVTAGIRYLVLHSEPVDEVNYAAFCPYPEAHTFFGECIADLTKDIQRMKSRIVRDMLDSLAQAVQPQTTIVEGQVNLDDVLNDDASKVIRQRQPGMIQHLVTPFVGKEAMPVIDYLTTVRENRTGQSDASAGLNAEALQSSTLAAVEGTLSKAQSRIEFVARIFAEMGMIRLYRGILHTIIKNQDPRMVVLAGRPMQISPRHWDADMSVATTLMLGRGSVQQQMGALTAILGKQEQILMQMGPENPLCDLDKYSYTLRKLVELAGWSNTTSFFSDTSQMDPQQKNQLIQSMTQHMQAAASKGKSGPDPQIEMAKIQANRQTEQEKLQLEMMKEHASVTLEALKIRGQMAVAMIQAMSDHTNEQTRMVLQQAIDQQTAQLDAFLGMHANTIDHQSNMVGHAKDLQIAKMQDDTARYTAAQQGGSDGRPD